MSFFCPYTTCPILQNERLQRPFAILRTNDIENPKTNADRIRAMSDEELAGWLATNDSCPSPEYERVCNNRCGECWLDWLKEEVSE